MSKLGAHIVQGSRNGYGSFCTSKPAVIVAVDEGGALGEAWVNSGGYTFTVFRDTTVYLEAPIEWNQTSDMIALARLYYPRLKTKWLQNPAEYYTITNETGGGEGSEVEANYRKLVAYEREVMRLANLDGFKVCILNCAGGSPGDINIWRNVCLPFILEAGQTGNVYGRHVYGQGNLVGNDGKVISGNPSRPLEESDILAASGYRSGIILTECGIDGGYGYAGDRFVAQMKDYEGAIRSKANIIAMACWTGGDWNNANCQDAFPALAQYNLANPTPKWTPGEVPPPQPPTLPAIRILKKPQKVDLTKAENDAANDYAWNNFGRTTTHSTDDMIRMLSGGNQDSYAILAYPNKPSQSEAVTALQSGGYRWVEWPEAVPGNPLDGLRLSHILPYRYMLTSPFNAPRDYANGLHEGCDYDVIGGQPDNKVNVLCAYDGVVDRSLKYGDYGEYIRVTHTRNGSTFYTRYAHLDARFVTTGNVVKAGDPLGEIGATGRVTGEHVHFNLEVPIYGLRGYVVDWVVNPEPYMATGRDTLPAIPAQTGLDMAKYFLPTSGNFGQILILKNNWGAGDERCQLQAENGVSFVTKNQQYERRTIDATYIRLTLDTSPGNGEFYTVTGNWLPRHMSPGATFTRTETITFKYKSNCQPVPSKPAYTTTSSIKFDQHHTSWTCPESGIILPDVIELSWFAGGKVDERYWFAAGLGLVKWEKYSGQKSWIHELVPVGSQGNNIRETGCFS